MLAVEGGLRPIGESFGEAGLMTTEAPASSTRGWLDQWFLGNLGIGAATEEESGQQPDTSDTYNQQYAMYNTRNNISFSYFCLSPMDDWLPGREKVE